MATLGSVRMPGGATALPTPVWQPGGPKAYTPGVASRIVPTDIFGPATVFVSETQAKVSPAAGFTTTTVTWNVSEPCQAWQIREVADSLTPIASAGQLVASGGAIPANADQSTDIVYSSLSVGDGSKLLKIFAQDTFGNWTP